MSYRPITDMWILARAKLKDGQKYYGAYLGGFPERARVLIGAGVDEPVLHVCGGMARHYPYDRGFGPNDKTLDMDPATKPDFVQDARLSYPLTTDIPGDVDGNPTQIVNWAGILIDPPYSPEDARSYVPGEESYPNPNLLVENAIQALPVGKKVGIIHYLWPKCPKNAKNVATVGVLCGFNNRIRLFSVYERVI